MALDLLIVDDSSAIRKILQRVLRHSEIPIGNILEAKDGKEALEILEVNKVGMILSDINMPQMDGLQLLSRLKSSEAWKQIPVIMITTEGGESKVLEAIRLGAAGYIRKPFMADEIGRRVKSLLSMPVPGKALDSKC